MPNVAQWVSAQIESTLSAAGTTAAKVGPGDLENAGVIYGGSESLGQGAVFAGMVLGATAALMRDLADSIDAADAAALALVPSGANGRAPERVGLPGAEPVPA